MRQRLEKQDLHPVQTIEETDLRQAADTRKHEGPLGPLN